MNNNNYAHDLVIFLGRMEPPTVAHCASIMEALKHGKFVMVGLGTHNTARTVKNPWNTEERIEMLKAAIPVQFHHRLVFVGLEDFPNDSEWVANVGGLARAAARQLVGKDDNIAILAHKKDDTTYYLDYFKFLKATIPFDEVKLDNMTAVLSATKIRELMFTGYLGLCGPALPAGVLEWISKWMGSEGHQYVQSEWDEGVKYEKDFHNAPYGNTNFYTADSVVIQSGHILLVQRGKAPGKGLWALPGGHVNNNETGFEASLRELQEETCIKVPRKVLIGSRYADKLYDDPDRSQRCRITGKYGRTVTHAHFYKLNDKEPLARVKGADDAAVAKWVAIDVFLNEMKPVMFEDHYNIASDAIKKVPDEITIALL
jgi:bifunctional NMN adenylyltransferase/nudix hydrolase